ncbi:hypothetical protein [Brevibacillus dissolubilis]|uniref:hypothetical protein n=1 Tax=Brevibacillus dissolubilis TaxID=1844116 RepID=UPI001117344A|nr:hypothetical protein [Brevibacillus dissolubilis]
MNCQEFRAKWPETVDELALSHIETCDECLHWIDTSFANDEEGVFMKHYPVPSPDLEDKIMQSIYTSANITPMPASGLVSTPPLAATETVSAADSKTTPLKKRKLPLFSYQWLGAASIFLVVGILSLQAMNGDDPTSLINKVNQKNAAASLAEQANDTPPSALPSTAQPGTMDLAQPAQGETAQAPDQTPEGASNQGQMTQPAAMGATGNAPMASRSAQQEAALVPQDPTAAPAGQDGMQARKMPAGHEESGTSGEKVVPMSGQSTPESRALSLSLPEASPTAPDAESTDDALRNSGGPALPTGEKTISTFATSKEAAQASNLPVPELSGSPEGFALDSLAIHYESETSKKATAISSIYRQGDTWMTLDVTETTKEKISIPGTFTDRQIFTVDGAQAIGVTFNQQDEQVSADHAVHFITSKDGHSLYVIVRAKGVTLTQLMEASKQIQWVTK